MKYKKDPDRIYTMMDFDDGEEIEFAYPPSHPSARVGGYEFYKSKKDGRTILLSPNDIARCLQ